MEEKGDWIGVIGRTAVSKKSASVASTAFQALGALHTMYLPSPLTWPSLTSEDDPLSLLVFIS